MKKVVFAIVLLAVIITGGLLENAYITRTFNDLDDMLKSLETHILDEDKSSLEEVREIAKWWEERRTYIELFAYSPDVRSFSVALGETDGSLECEDYQNALSKCRSLMIMANNIKELLDFNARDII